VDPKFGKEWARQERPNLTTQEFKNLILMEGIQLRFMKH
jgi:hypothetical protein